jgi:hypothetical protein
MKGPPRLLEKGATDVERSLLVAGSVEQPSEDWMKSSRVALGLGAGLTAATVSTSVAAGAKAGIPTAVKIVAAVFSVTAAVGSALYLSHDRNLSGSSASIDRSAASEATAIQTVMTPAAEVAQKPAEPAAEPAAPADLVSDHEAPQPRPSSPPVSSPLAASPKTLGSEIASLDEIKNLLSGGDPAAALAAIVKYRRDYPKPALGPEATVLEVQALTARGDRARAALLARRFIKMYPSSPHARQFEQLLSTPHDP